MNEHKKLKNASTEKLAEFLYDLQFRYTPYIKAIRKELTNRLIKSNKPFYFRNAIWRCNKDTMSGTFHIRKGDNAIFH